MTSSGGSALAPAASETSLPSVSVVVRSYRRIGSLLRLLRVVLAQDYPDFEVVVIEQSEASGAERAALDELMASDSRLRILYTKPLGSGGARNAGWRAARGEIVLLIDDDDLPVGRDFIRGHAVNYADPTILAVTGRHVYSVDERCGYRNRSQARRRCLRYNRFGYPHVYCRFDERIESVDWIHGTNASVRRAAIELVGGWEDAATAHDEHALCQQLMSRRRAGERFVFDPSIRLLRSKDELGGAGLRWSGPRRIFDGWCHYFRNVAARYYPRWKPGYRLIVPFVCWFLALRWVWFDAKLYRTVPARLAATLHVLVAGPLWCARALVARTTAAQS